MITAVSIILYALSAIFFSIFGVGIESIVSGRSRASESAVILILVVGVTLFAIAVALQVFG